MISVISIFIFAANIGYFTIYYLCLIILISAFYFLFKLKLETYGKNDLLAQKELKKIVQESFEGIKNVIIYNQFNFFSENYKKLFNRRESYAQKIFTISQFPSNFLEFIAISFFCLYVFISFSKDVSSGDFIYSLGIISYGSFRILSYVKLAISNFNVLKEKKYATEFIMDELKFTKSISKLKITSKNNSLKKKQVL